MFDMIEKEKIIIGIYDILEEYNNMETFIKENNLKEEFEKWKRKEYMDCF